MCGQTSHVYSIDTPDSIETSTLEVIAQNNDNEWFGEQEESSQSDVVEIMHDPNPPPNPV
ncbi:MAG: hypothetical protein JW776_16820 [Candidatus Lokiarchaeota archaeon]|nr:hypothetical protein [Candidatus Lokiarchaeota archaeon]